VRHGRGDAEAPPHQPAETLLQEPTANGMLAASGDRETSNAPPHDRTRLLEDREAGSKVDTAGGTDRHASRSRVFVRREWCCCVCNKDLRLLPFVQLAADRIRCRRCPDPLDGAA
jgi:hypothetical protein